jgi:hypothetical protein
MMMGQQRTQQSQGPGPGPRNRIMTMMNKDNDPSTWATERDHWHGGKWVLMVNNDGGRDREDGNDEKMTMD